MDGFQAPAYLFVAEAAKYLRINPSSVYDMLWSGRLPGYKVGGKWRIAQADLDALLAGQLRTETEEERVQRWIATAPALSDKQKDVIATAFAGSFTPIKTASA
ncbi:helix-turn-helix domain-containing protein [Mycobacterium numidiamassiliense]|uniref:helix-turn-helix domain-containing protein n=1 Tax=Mycobacterium numidiamassiliense TaxID=1841861 RepID=UPI00097D121D|nr:helix-turn-helix domain-containing protein [Mycobacterium numidiamassiliense]